VFLVGHIQPIEAGYADRRLMRKISRLHLQSLCIAAQNAPRDANEFRIMRRNHFRRAFGHLRLHSRITVDPISLR